MSDNQEELNNFDNLQAANALASAKAELEALNQSSEEVPQTSEADAKVLANSEPKAREFNEIEKEQMDKGWDPNKPDGVSAVEFKRVGEIIEAKRKASKEAQAKTKEVEELKANFKKLVEHNKALEKATYEKAQRDLYNQKLQKIEEGDVTAVLEIERQQANLTKPLELEVSSAEALEAPVSNNDYIFNHPDVVSFRDEFKDILMGKSDEDLAISAYIQVKANQYQTLTNDEEIKAAISAVKEGLKKQFPNKFTNPNKDKPALTMKSTASGSTASGASINRLSHEQRNMYAQIKQADPSYELAEFVKQLELTGRLA